MNEKKKTGGGGRKREREKFLKESEKTKKHARREVGEKWRSRCENRGKLKANKVEYGGGRERGEQ